MMKKINDKQQVTELPSEYSSVVILLIVALGITIYISIVVTYLISSNLNKEDFKFMFIYFMIGTVCFLAFPDFYKIYIQDVKIIYKDYKLKIIYKNDK